MDPKSMSKSSAGCQRRRNAFTEALNSSSALNTTQASISSKVFSFHLNLRKIVSNSYFQQILYSSMSSELLSRSIHEVRIIM